LREPDSQRNSTAVAPVSSVITAVAAATATAIGVGRGAILGPATIVDGSVAAAATATITAMSVESGFFAKAGHYPAIHATVAKLLLSLTP
jgi:hypothetical protein